MLWSFGQIRRPHLQAPFLCLTLCNFIYPRVHFIRPVPYSLRRWAARVPPAIDSKSRRAIDTDIQGSQDVRKIGTENQNLRKEQSTEGNHPRQDAKIEEQAPLPVELLAAIDTVSLRHYTTEETLSYFQRHPHISVLLDHLQDRDRAQKLAETLATSRTPGRAVRTLIIAYKLGTVFKQNAYECIIHRLATGCHWQHVLSVVKLGKQHTGRTTVWLLNWRVRAIIGVAHFRLLKATLKEFEDNGFQPNRRTFHLLVYGFIRNRDLISARNCMTKMKDAGFPLDSSTHAIIVSAYRSLGPDSAVQEKALESLANLRVTEATIVLNSLIQFALDSDDLAGALHYLSLFGAPQDTPSVDGQKSAGSALISPDATTFTMLIANISKNADIDRLPPIINQMDLFGIKPDTVLIAAVIRVFCAAEDIGGAICIVTHMCKGDSTLKTIIPMNTAPLLHPNSNIEDQILPIIPSDLSPDIHIFNALMYGMLASFGISGGSSTLHLMHKEEVTPNVATIEALANHLTKYDQQDARTVISVIDNLLSVARLPTLKLLHISMSSILQQRRLQQKQAVMKERGHGSKHNRAEGHPRELPSHPLVKHISQSLESRDVHSDRVSFALRMTRALAAGDLHGTSEIFHTMLEHGIHPNTYHYRTLMQRYVDAGDVVKAEEVLQSAISAGVKPNAIMYTVLIVARGRQKNPVLAKRAFDDMIAQGIQPDQPAIHAVANAFFLAGQSAVARKVLLDLWSSIAPFPWEIQHASFRKLAREFKKIRAHESPPKVTSLNYQHNKSRLKNKLRRLVKRWKAPKIRFK